VVKEGEKASKRHLIAPYGRRIITLKKRKEEAPCRCSCGTYVNAK